MEDMARICFGRDMQMEFTYIDLANFASMGTQIILFIIIIGALLHLSLQV